MHGKGGMLRIELNDVLVGGQRVGFNRSTRTLHIAGEELSPEDWLVLRRRIDRTLKHELNPDEWQELKERMAREGKLDRLPMALREHEQPRATKPTGLMERLRFWWAEKRLGM